MLAPYCKEQFYLAGLSRLLQIYKRSISYQNFIYILWTIAKMFLLVSKCSWSFSNRSLLLFLSFASILLMVQHLLREFLKVFSTPANRMLDGMLFQWCEWNTLRRIKNKLKIVHGFHDSQTVCSLFKLNESPGARGYPFKLRKKTLLTNQYAHLFHSHHWNNMQSNIVLAGVLNTFKNIFQLTNLQ